MSFWVSGLVRVPSLSRCTNTWYIYAIPIKGDKGGEREGGYEEEVQAAGGRQERGERKPGMNWYWAKFLGLALDHKYQMEPSVWMKDVGVWWFVNVGDGVILEKSWVCFGPYNFRPIKLFKPIKYGSFVASFLHTKLLLISCFCHYMNAVANFLLT